MGNNRVQDGKSCSGCGLPNYNGLCPHCRGDREEYERELVPPFPSSYEENNPCDSEVE